MGIKKQKSAILAGSQVRSLYGIRETLH